MKKLAVLSAAKKSSNCWLDVVRLIVECTQLLVVACTLVTLYFSLYPQAKPNNSNLLEMANAGDYHSQIKLAHFYFETGDYSDAVYWYKVALLSDKDANQNKLALNNLGYLYAHGYGLATEAVSEKERLRIALSLFDKATQIDEFDDDLSIVAMNKYLLLITFGENMFDDYESEMNNTLSLLARLKNYDGSSIVPERRIRSQETISSPISLSVGWEDDNTLLSFSGARTKQLENRLYAIEYIYVRTVYEEGDNKLPELQYMSPVSYR